MKRVVWARGRGILGRYRIPTRGDPFSAAREEKRAAR